MKAFIFRVLFGVSFLWLFTAQAGAWTTTSRVSGDSSKVILSQHDIDLVKKASAAVDETTRNEFDRCCKEWVDTLNSVSVKIRSLRVDPTSFPQYKKLVAMGEKVIPLAVEKLVSEGYDCKNVMLYMSLQTDKDLLPNEVKLDSNQLGKYYAVLWLRSLR